MHGVCKACHRAARARARPPCISLSLSLFRTFFSSFVLFSSVSRQWRAVATLDACQQRASCSWCSKRWPTGARPCAATPRPLRGAPLPGRAAPLRSVSGRCALASAPLPMRTQVLPVRRCAPLLQQDKGTWCPAQVLGWRENRSLALALCVCSSSSGQSLAYHIAHDEFVRQLSIERADSSGPVVEDRPIDGLGEINRPAEVVGAS